MLGTIGALIAGSLGSSLIGAHAANQASNAQVNASHEANQLQRYIFNRSVDLTQPARTVGNNALASLAYINGVGPMPQQHDYSITERQVPGQPASTGATLGWNGQPGPAGQGTDPTTQYFVGDQQFKSRRAAQNWIDNQPGNFDFQGFQADPGYQFRLDQGNQALERSLAARGIRLGGAGIKAGIDYNQGSASQEYGNWYNRLAGLAGVGQTATQQQLGAGQNYANAAGQNFLSAGNARASGYMGVNDAMQGGINNLFNIFGMQQAGMFK